MILPNEKRKTNKRINVLVGFLGFLGLFGFLPSAQAFAPLTLRHAHHLFTVDADAYPHWQEPEEVWMLHGREVRAPAELRVDGDSIPPLPPGIVRSQKAGWNRGAIERTLQKLIATPLERAPGSVVIRRSASGAIVFEGVGMLGREVQLSELANLVVTAIEADATDVEIPINETQPQITVEDATLRNLGITEVVTVGESDFSGSPIPRRHNITTGMSKFNGHLIPQEEIFSFNEVLGRVDGSTGYWKELVIMGEYTLPEYGGGLCQVSTTAYRGAWERGFPIIKRRNHSFAVTYYSPQGTDATIFPPNVDMEFKNDGPSALLIQTHIEDSKAYFIYYGTRDQRKTEMLGPYLWDFKSPPADREELTTEIPPGERRKASDKHPGMKAAWFRFVTPPEGEEIKERIYSAYAARGLLYQTGVAPTPKSEEIPPETAPLRKRKTR